MEKENKNINEIIDIIANLQTNEEMKKYESELKKILLLLNEVKIENNEYIKKNRNEKNYIKSIFDNIDVAIFVMDEIDTEKFVYTRINPTHEKLTGLKSSEISGKSVGEIFGEETGEILKKNYRRCISEGSTVEYEEKIYFGNEETWWLTKLIPIFVEDKIVRIVGTSIYINKLKKEEEKSRTKEQFLEILLNTIPNPIFYKDEKLRYIGCNSAFEKFIGISKKDLFGKTVYDISPKELADKYHEKDMELLNNPPVQSYESRVKTKKGEIRDVLFNKKTYYMDNKIAGMIGVILDITELKTLEAMLRDLAIKDELTGIYNRRGINELTKALLKNAIRNKTGVAVFMIDIDNFKPYNDYYGHLAGDKCLKEVAEILKIECRRPLDFVGRYGGDEFLVLLSDIDEKSAVKVAEKIGQRMNKRFAGNRIGESDKYLSLSIGICIDMPKTIEDLDEFVKKADEKLYIAKEKGKNRIEI